MFRRVAVSFVALMVCAAALLAQQHPNKEKGFNPDRLYDFKGLDTINTFNGNLIVTIPLGQKYGVNAGLSYGLTLVYNGVVWDEYGAADPSNPCPTYLEATSSRRSNAGNGWLVSLGRLIAPGDQWGHSGLVTFDDGTATTQNWVYESPDGHDHVMIPSGTTGIYVPYKESGPPIRLRKDPDSSDYWIEFPDGSYHVFHNIATGSNPAKYRITAMKDRFGNGAYVTYNDVAGSASLPDHSTITYDEEWLITQYANGAEPPATSLRQQRLYFKNHIGRPDGTGDTTYNQKLLLAIDQSAVGGQRSWTTFDYGSLGPAILTRPSWDHSKSNGGGGYTVGDPINVYLLNGVKFLATGESYSFSYAPAGGDNGSLSSMRLPTGGGIAWTYQNTEFWSLRIGGIDTDPGLSSTCTAYKDTNYGVATRTLLDQSMNPMANSTTTYERSFSPWENLYYPDPDNPGHQIKEVFRNVLMVTVREPRVLDATGALVDGGSATTHHYSIFNDRLGPTKFAEVPESWTWSRDEYGLPLDRYTQVTGADGQPLFLSTEVYSNSVDSNNPGTLVRTTFTRYEGTEEQARRTTYNGDTSCTPAGTTDAVTCYAESFSRNFKNGRYQQLSTYANFTDSNGNPLPSNARTTFTNYNTPTADAYLLNTYSEQCVQNDAAAGVPTFHSGTVTSCADLTGSTKALQTYSFDMSNGFLNRRRVYKGSTAQADDLITAYVSETLGNGRATGNVAEERSYGAKDGGIVTDSDNLASVVLSDTPPYRIVNTYSAAGVLATSKYDGFNALTVDQTVDDSTGLVTASRDPSGLPTTYGYDTAGRLKSVTAPGLPPLTYTYNAFDSGTSTLASVEATQDASTVTRPAYLPAGLYGKTYTIYDFDALGRLKRERNLLADDTTSVRTTEYDALWNKLSVSAVETYVEGSDPQHKTTFAYDTFGRVRKTTAPDGSVTTADYTNEGSHRLARTAHIGTAAGDTPVTTYENYDTNGKLVSVEEPSGPNNAKVTTVYGYDVADRLATVDMAGSEATQHREFRYDNRGFLLWEQHPELGRTGNGKVVYGASESDPWYDSRGHALRKVTGSINGAFDLGFVYDKAEHLRAVQHNTAGGAEDIKRFEYSEVADSSNHKQGKLETATRHNRLSTGDVRVTETYDYSEPGGRVHTRTTAVERVDASNTVTAALQTFTQSFDYSPFGGVEHAPQPTCSTSTPCAQPVPMLSAVTNLFHNGKLVGVDDWAAIQYDPSGLVRSITHKSNAPGAVAQLDEQIPDSNGMPRPQEIKFSGYCVGPQINAAEPADQVQTATAAATLSISAVTGATGYQWYQVTPSGPLMLTGETGLTLQLARLSQDTQYFVRVTGNGCASDSRIATVTTPCTGVKATMSPDVTIASGNSATFTATPTPSNAIVDWYLGSTKVGTGTSFTTPALTASATYTTTITSGACTMPGPSATANVCAPLAFTAPLTDVTDVATGGTLTVASAVSVTGGSAPYTFRWTVAGTVAPDITTSASSASYNVAVAAGTSVTVKVDVFSCGQHVTSATVTYKALASAGSDATYCPTSIFYWGPISAMVAEPGQALRLTLAMSPNEADVQFDPSKTKPGDPPPPPPPHYTYRWYRGNGTEIANPNNNNYLDVTTYDHDSFYATALSQECGTLVTTQKAYIKVYGHCPLTPVTVSPAEVDVASGATTTLEAYSEWPKVQYQWYKGELGNTRVPVDGVSQHPYQLSVTSEPATYWVRITSECGETLDSNLAVVNRTGTNACDAVVVHRTTPDSNVAAGSVISLGVDANSSSALTYQWHRLTANGDEVLAGSDYINLVRVPQSALYSVHITNACGATADTKYIYVHVTSCGSNSFTTGVPATFEAQKDVPFSITVATASPVANIQWFEGVSGDPNSVATGVSGPTFTGTYAASTKLWARATTTDGCTFDTGTAVIDVCEPPSVRQTTAQGTNIVAGQYTFIGFNTSGTNLTYDWWVYDTPDAAARQLGVTTPSAQVHPFVTTRYYVKVSNACGTVTSPDYYVSYCPNITQLSASATTVMSGSTVQLSVLGDGYYMKYTWYKGHRGDFSQPLASTPNGQFTNGAFTYTTAPLSAETTFWATATSGTCTSWSDEITIHMCAVNPYWNTALLQVKANQQQTITVAAAVSGVTTVFYRGTSGDVAGSTMIQNTSSSLSVSVAPAATTTYWARVTDPATGCWADTPTLTISVCIPQITQQPQSQMVNPGATAHLSVGTDVPGSTYQWFEGTTPIAGQTSATLDIVPSADTTYKVRVTGTCTQYVDSDPATVTICKPAVINNGPVYSTNISPGGSADLAVAAVGTGLHFQWYIGASGTTTTPTGTDSNTLHVTPSSTTMYWVKVTGTCGTANSPTGTVSVCPVISQQPAPAKAYVASGTGTTISVTASASPITYQWYQGAAGDTSHPVGNGTSVLTTDPLTATTSYWVTITSGFCTVQSTAATVNLCAVNPYWNVASTQVKASQTQTITIAAAVSGVTTVFYRGNSGDTTNSTIIQNSSSSLSTSVSPAATTNYWVRVTDPATGCVADTPTLTINVCIPQITQQPQSQMINSGGTAHLTVATDVSPATYQWYNGSTPISGATNSYYDASPTADTTYKVRVTGNCSQFVDSQTATVSICQPPAITSPPPAAVNLNPGNSYDLSVTATGTGLSYQWYVGASGTTTTPTGTNSRTLHVTPSVTTSYWVKVSGTCGSQNSTTSTVSVCPAITQQPTPAANNIHTNSSTTITVAASGSPLIYQWYQGAVGDTSHAVGTNSSTLSTGPLAATTSYWVMITSGSCAVASQGSTVNVCELSTWFTTGISTQVRANYPQTLTLSVPAGTIGSIYRGTAGDVAGSTLLTQSGTTTVSPTTTTSYWGRLTDPNNGCYGDTSTVTITVCIPTITSQPQSVTVSPSTPVTLSVGANGGTLTYQWYSGTTAIPNATGSSYTFTPSQSPVSYWVRVTGTCGQSVDSSTATVTICSPPTITTQPTSGAAVYPGQNQAASVAASGSGLTYQWYQGVAPSTTTPFTGKTGTLLSLPLNYTTQAWVRVSGQCGSPADSNTVFLSVRPTIYGGPASVTLNSGSTASFSVTADGTFLTYQWYLNDLSHPIAGATGSTYFVPSVTASASYTCQVGSGTASVNAGWADATLCSGPQIYRQPYISPVGSCKYLVVDMVYDGSNMTYQWYLGTRGDVTHPAANGNDHALYLCNQPGTYWLRITNADTGCYTDSNAYTVTFP